jgi:hypothetical protein
VKETWLDQGFGEDLLAGDRLALPATTQPAEIVALVSRQEERLIGELERLARECPTPDTAALLKALASMAQSRLTRWYTVLIASTISEPDERPGTGRVF